MRTIYDWLAEVQKRPSMWFATLGDLQTMVHGYLTALGQHQIDEGVPHMQHFVEWKDRK